MCRSMVISRPTFLTSILILSRAFMFIRFSGFGLYIELCNTPVDSFYRASYASAVLAVVVCPSVCPSVCLSVCLSQAGIVSKRQHIESRKQRRTVAQGI